MTLSNRRNGQPLVLLLLVLALLLLVGTCRGQTYRESPVVRENRLRYEAQKAEGKARARYYINERRAAQARLYNYNTAVWNEWAWEYNRQQHELNLYSLPLQYPPRPQVYYIFHEGRGW
jgi:hypothetical protein